MSVVATPSFGHVVKIGAVDVIAGVHVEGAVVDHGRRLGKVGLNNGAWRGPAKGRSGPKQQRAFKLFGSVY